jgi:hypothetical protein
MQPYEMLRYILLKTKLFLMHAICSIALRYYVQNKVVGKYFLCLNNNARKKVI